MEKIGVEVAITTVNDTDSITKVARANEETVNECTHPESSIERPDVDVAFCKKCGKYLR